MNYQVNYSCGCVHKLKEKNGLHSSDGIIKQCGEHGKL